MLRLTESGIRLRVNRYWLRSWNRSVRCGLDDKRHYARVPIDMDVSCECAGAPAFVARGKDISVGGMYLEAHVQPSFGTELTLVGRLPGSKKDVRLPGVVRWTKPGGFGVQFGLLGALETHLLSELMK